ncbi:MAG: cation-translocating P-type ATPase [Alphaproteobacteria bacterium]|nr:cation-translocating P-type ATPase [Alphaproteobacteria bacterium]
MNWFEKSKAKVTKELNSDANAGLGPDAVISARKKFGENQFKEPKGDSIFVMILSHLKNIAAIILLVAAALSLFMEIYYGDGLIEFLVIMAIIILNVTLAVTQEMGAERALAALRKLNSPTSIVIRGGRRVEIASEDLVPGDVMLLKTGDMISADARLLEETDFMVDESALTGESTPVEKNTDATLSGNVTVADQSNMVFRGCLVAAGRAKAIVVATGMDTQMGRIAEYLTDARKLPTPLQVRIDKVGKAISVIGIASAAMVFVIGFIRGSDFWDMAFLAIALGVAAVPETLPLIVTLSLSHGVKEMVKKHALIRKLPAVETLGSTSVICSDKTGTLTQNRMDIKRLWRAGGKPFGDDAEFSPEQMELLEGFALTTHAVDEAQDDGTIKVIGTPTEAAIINLLIKKGGSVGRLEKNYPRVAEIPFSSERKMATTVHKHPDGGYIVLTCGAFDRIPFKKIGNKPHEIHDGFARDALRILALGIKHIKKLPNKAKWGEFETDLDFFGLIGLIDPPRVESAPAVALARAAGIRTIMITGDHAVTAEVIARDIGILSKGDKVLTGKELSEINEARLMKNITGYSVFARVSPEDKIRIVKAWQARDAVVAMTGDGVNDAPALKVADVGVAMGVTGTEVAKGAADMVLTDDNYSSIVDAVRWGRGVFSNIRKTVYFLLTCNFSEIILILGAKIMGWGIPLTPIMLLLINVVCDGVPGMALAREKPDSDIMRRRPVARGASLFDGLKTAIIIQVAAFVAVGFTAYYIGKFIVLSDAYLPSHILGQTMAFIVIGWTSIWHIFTVRSRRSVFRTPVMDNPILAFSALGTTILTVLLVVIPPLADLFGMTPVGIYHWLAAFGLSILPTFTAEAYKLMQAALKK